MSPSLVWSQFWCCFAPAIYAHFSLPSLIPKQESRFLAYILLGTGKHRYGEVDVIKTLVLQYKLQVSNSLPNQANLFTPKKSISQKGIKV